MTSELSCCCMNKIVTWSDNYFSCKRNICSDKIWIINSYENICEVGPSHYWLPFISLEWLQGVFMVLHLKKGNNLCFTWFEPLKIQIHTVRFVIWFFSGTYWLRISNRSSSFYSNACKVQKQQNMSKVSFYSFFWMLLQYTENQAWSSRDLTGSSWAFQIVLKQDSDVSKSLLIL